MKLNFTKKIALLVVLSSFSFKSEAQCVNQLVNGGFEIDATTGWTTTNGGDGFALTGTSHSGNNGLKGSYAWSSQVQVVDLVAVGYNSLALDAAPNIEVSEWYRSNGGGADNYYYKAELLDISMTVVATFSLGSQASPEITTGTWQEVNNVFTGYGTGVRFVRITHGSKDTEFWAGHYGAVIDDSYVGVGAANTGTDIQIACDTYDWIDGNTYTADNNTATYILTNVAGCDSVVTLDLTMNNSSAGTDVQIACGSYLWIDGNTYTSDNTTATHTLTNATNCDSIVTLDLTINALPDNSTTLNGFSITAAEVGVSYQWIDCDDNNSELLGATDQTYTAITNGNYAVVVTGTNCSDTSDCVTISGVGINELNSLEISIFPNPNNGTFFINSLDNNVTVTITTIDGKVIVSGLKLIEANQQVNLGSIETGIYFVTVANQTSEKTVRLVVE